MDLEREKSPGRARSTRSSGATSSSTSTVRVGDHIVESVITRRSAEEMALKKGDTVTAVVKATEVMLSKG